MKKFRTLVGCFVLTSMMLTACSGKEAADLANEAADAASNLSESDIMDISKLDVDSYISELGQYTGLTIEADKKLVITDATVDQYIEYVLNQAGIAGETKEVDRAIQTGDVVNIDYVGTKDGVAFDGGTGNYDLTIGSGQFIPGFEDGLIGHSKGEVVNLPLTFPEQYQSAELAGQSVNFEVTINTVSEQEPGTITDDYVKGLGIDNVTNVDEFKAYIKTSLENNAENTYQNGKRDALLNAIYEKSSFTDVEMPEALMNYYVEQITADDTKAATSYGTTIEEYVSVMYDKTYDEYMEAAKEEAKVKLRNAILCHKIAVLEGITVTDEEVEQELVNNANQYGYQSVDDFLKVINKDDFRNYIIEVKVIDKLLENTTVVEKDDTSEATTETATSESEEATTEAETESESATEAAE